MDSCILAFSKRKEEKLYRIYITDALKILTENTSNFAGGTKIEQRFADLAYEDKKPQKQTESADEIKERIKNGINNLGKG